MGKIINLFNIPIAGFDTEEIIKSIIDFSLNGKAKFITYLNAHCVNITFLDREYKDILLRADLVYAEGKGVVWASAFMDRALPGRLNILDFFDKLAPELKENRLSIYLLGNKEEIVKKTAERLKNNYNLDILGFYHGFFNEAEEKNIISEINRLKPNILMVGLGVPKQEKWIYSHINGLNVNLCWAVGAAFDWLSGYRRRAPEWMIKSGFEWLHRLIQEPRRLWKRYLIGNFVFIFRVFKYKF